MAESLSFLNDEPTYQNVWGYGLSRRQGRLENWKWKVECYDTKVGKGEYFCAEDLAQQCSDFAAGRDDCECQFCGRYAQSSWSPSENDFVSSGFSLIDGRLPKRVVLKLLRDRRVADILLRTQVPSQFQEKLAQQLRQLTAKESKDVGDAIGCGDVVAHLGNAEITGIHMQCLRDGVWLNDEIINAYITLLNGQLQESDSSVFIASTFWATKLKGKFVSEEFLRWLKTDVEIGKLTKLILPFHVGNNHWCLGTIDIPIRRLAYYDSLRGSGETFLDLMQKMKTALGRKEEFRRDTPAHIPRQHNGCDCGVFMLMYARYISENLPFAFGAGDMQMFRKKIALAIVNKTSSDLIQYMFIICKEVLFYVLHAPSVSISISRNIWNSIVIMSKTAVFLFF
jgi:sentrin-specific protease 1